MLKNNGKKAAITAASTGCVCLLLLLVAVQQQQHHRAQLDAEPSAEQDAGTRALLREEDAPAKSGFSAYFTKLTRGRREVERPARSPASSADPPPAEDIGAGDIFIAVKTTKKFHQSRLNLLLDTWISRNMQQVKDQCKKKKKTFLRSVMFCAQGTVGLRDWCGGDVCFMAALFAPLPTPAHC